MDNEVSNRLHRAIVDRRMLLRSAALAGIAASGASVPLIPANAEIWEEGDIQCQPVIAEVAPDYNTEELLDDFMSLSRMLTGVDSLDKRIGAQYLQRYARNSELTKLLPPLVNAYRGTGPLEPAYRVDAIKRNIMQEARVLGPAAEQLIFLWYVSAFFLPVDHAAASRNWLYGTVEQYHYALLWSVIDAHAPMTRGGDPGYWAGEPKQPRKAIARSRASNKSSG
jgi:hypothetical protein